MAWATNGTPDNSSASDATMDISDMTATVFNQVLTHIILPNSGTGWRTEYIIQSNTNTDYADRREENGGADATQTSQAHYELIQNGPNDGVIFTVQNIINVDGEEKLIIAFGAYADVAGAGTAPNRQWTVAKVDTTTNSGQFTEIDVQNTAFSTTLAADSNMSAIGTD